MKNEELKILYEDNHLIVVVKPQNVPTQADSSGDESLLDAVKSYVKVKYEKTGNVYIGLVHRLDRPTGGVMVFAKTSKSASRLSEQLQNGDFEKKYLAVTVGVPRDRAKMLDNWLVKDTATNTVKVVPAKIEGAKRAELVYKVVDEIENKMALVDVRLLTGRAHQVRVQLKNVGTPIFGDARYGGDIAKGHNLALWAYQLTFLHPITKNTMVFKVFPPTEDVPWNNFKLEKHINTVRPDA